MSASWRALPTCSTQLTGETMPEYQARCLRFLLETSCTATLSEAQLEAAEAAGARSCAAVVGRDATAERTLAILSAARHTIAAVLKFRRERPITTPERVSGAARPNPSGGKPAPLQPGPTVQPPAPSYASVGDSIPF